MNTILNLSDLKLSVVIVSYDSLKTIAETLNPLFTLYKKGVLKVVVIDNHGADGVKELLLKDYPWVSYKLADKNLGFGKGCNLGFHFMKSQYTLFLNPDAVIEPHSVKELVEYMDSNLNVAITAPAIVIGDEEDSVLQFAGHMPVPVFGGLYFKKNQKEVREISLNAQPFKTTWLSGAILMFRSSIFKSLGGFDERFFLYFEETDLFKRSLEHGYEIWANGTVIAKHIVGASSEGTGFTKVSGCIAEHYYKSRYYFIKKHYGVASAISHEIIELILIFIKSLKYRAQGRKNPFLYLKIRLSSPFFSEP